LQLTLFFTNDRYEGTLVFFDLVLLENDEDLVTVIREDGERVGGVIEEDELRKGVHKVWRMVKEIGGFKEEGEKKGGKPQSQSQSNNNNAGDDSKSDDKMNSLHNTMLNDIRTLAMERQKDRRHHSQSHKHQSKKMMLFDNVMEKLQISVLEQAEEHKFEKKREKERAKKRLKEGKKADKRREKSERKAKRKKKRELRRLEQSRNIDASNFDAFDPPPVSDENNNNNNNNNIDTSVSQINLIDSINAQTTTVLKANQKSEFDRLNNERRKLKNDRVTATFEQKIERMEEEEAHYRQHHGKKIIIRAGEERIIEYKPDAKEQEAIVTKLSKPKYVSDARDKIVEVPLGYSNMTGRQRPDPNEEIEVKMLQLSPKRINGWVERQVRRPSERSERCRSNTRRGNHAAYSNCTHLR